MSADGGDGLPGASTACLRARLGDRRQLADRRRCRPVFADGRFGMREFGQAGQCVLHGGEDLDALDGIDAEVGFEGHAGFEHFGGIAGLFGDQCPEGFADVLSRRGSGYRSHGEAERKQRATATGATGADDGLRAADRTGCRKLNDWRRRDGSRRVYGSTQRREIGGLHRLQEVFVAFGQIGLPVPVRIGDRFLEDAVQFCSFTGRSTHRGMCRSVSEPTQVLSPRDGRRAMANFRLRWALGQRCAFGTVWRHLRNGTLQVLRSSASGAG